MRTLGYQSSSHQTPKNHSPLEAIVSILAVGLPATTTIIKLPARGRLLLHGKVPECR
jgi:hypothetical protein